MTRDQLLNLFFKTDHLASRIEREKARVIYAVTWLMGAIAFFLIFVFPLNNTVFQQQLAQGNYLLLFAGGVASILPVVTIVLVRAGRIQIISQSLIVILFLSLVSVAFDDVILSAEYMAFALVILLSALLFELRDFSIIASVSFVFLALQELNQVLFQDQNSTVPLLTTGIYLIIIGAAYSFIRYLRTSRLEATELEGEQRFKLADINSRITRQASARIPLREALDTTLGLIVNNYTQFYHAQVFLIDADGVQARLAASTGEAGKRLIEKGHSLAVGSLSVIGQTTFRGEPVIASAEQDESVHKENLLLAQTKLEAAFPLVVGDKIIGALDLQSKQSLDLTESDKLTYQSIANSLALSIDNIRQFETAQARVEENQRLTEQTRSALREVERLNQRLIGRAWSEYLGDKGHQVGLNVDLVTGENTSATRWTSTLAEAAKQNYLVNEGRVVAIPLKVRGQVIGAMEFEMDENDEFTPEDFELLQEISERFGLAAENTRLLEESQRIAQRETLINEISSRLQSATNIEATLTEAARSFTDTLGVNRVMIRLGAPDDDKDARTPQANGQSGAES